MHFIHKHINNFQILNIVNKTRTSQTHNTRVGACAQATWAAVTRSGNFQPVWSGQRSDHYCSTETRTDGQILGAFITLKYRLTTITKWVTYPGVVRSGGRGWPLWKSASPHVLPCQILSFWVKPFERHYVDLPQKFDPLRPPFKVSRSLIDTDRSPPVSVLGLSRRFWDKRQYLPFFHPRTFNAPLGVPLGIS